MICLPLRRHNKVSCLEPLSFRPGERVRGIDIFQLDQRQPVKKSQETRQSPADQRDAAGMESGCEVHDKNLSVHQKDVRPPLEVEVDPAPGMNGIDDALKLFYHSRADLAPREPAEINAVEIFHGERKGGEPLCRSEQSVNAGKGAVCAELPADDHTADEVALPKTFRAEVLYDNPAAAMTGDEHAGLGKTALREDLFDVRCRFSICEIQIHNPLSAVMVEPL